MSWHHPDYDHPEWVIDVGNREFHKIITIMQRMNPTPENLAVIRGLIDSLEYEYLQKRRVLDVKEGIGKDSAAVKRSKEKANEGNRR